MTKTNFLTIKNIGSGSDGNCYLIDDGRTQLLLECGFNFKVIQQALNFKTSKISGCLISHRHGDHIKGLKDLLHRGFNCFISGPERDALCEIDKKYQVYNLRPIEPLKAFKIGSFTVLPFDVMHDTEQPLGYLIESENGSKLLFATDTYYIPYKFAGVTHLLIECNNSLSIMADNVEKGVLAASLKKRIEKSHFSLENLKTFLKDCDLSKLQEVCLIHLSNTNSDEMLFKREIQKTTGQLVKVF